jgi:uncharacterized protein
MEKILILLIKSYKLLVSPFLPQCCRFAPTCSEYAIEAVRRYGTLKGSYLSCRRLMKCHPFHPGGYDPVKTEWKKELS